MVEKLSKEFIGVAALSAAGLAVAMNAFSQASSDEILTADIFESMHNAGYAQTLDEIPQPDILENAVYADNSYIDFDHQIDDILAAVNEEERYSVNMANGNFLSFGKIVPSVVGPAFTEFCNSNPIDCTQNGEEPLSVSREAIPYLVSAHKDFSEHFVYVLDEDLHGVPEKFNHAVLLDDVHPDNRMLAGDCEDFGLSLAQYFNQNFGIDYSSMSLAVVDPHLPDDPSLHALLVVRTDDGDLLFNNNGDSFMAGEAFHRYGYTFLQAQALQDKSVWQQIELKPFGVEATMEMLPEYREIPLPRPRPSGNGMDI